MNKCVFASSIALLTFVSASCGGGGPTGPSGGGGGNTGGGGGSTPCTYTLTVDKSSLSASADSGTATVNLSSGSCTWTASAVDSWVHLSKTSGSGSDSFTYS